MHGNVTKSQQIVNVFGARRHGFTFSLTLAQRPFVSFCNQLNQILYDVLNLLNL